MQKKHIAGLHPVCGTDGPPDYVDHSRSGLGCMHLHRFVDAVKQVVWSELSQDAEAIECLLGSDRFEPRNGKADISRLAMIDHLGERLRRGKVDVCDTARLESRLITACPQDLSATDQDGNCALRHDFIHLAAEDQTTTLSDAWEPREAGTLAARSARSDQSLQPVCSRSTHARACIILMAHADRRLTCSSIC